MTKPYGTVVAESHEAEITPETKVRVRAVALVCVVASACFGCIRLGFFASDATHEIRTMSGALQSLQVGQVELRREMQQMVRDSEARMNEHVSTATAKRWTMPHAEATLRLQREALATHELAAVAKDWPTVDTVVREVERYSVADAAYKATNVATPR